MTATILINGWLIKDWHCKAKPVFDHMAISVIFVQLLYLPHTVLNNHFFNISSCSLNHGSPLLSICNSLEVINFPAFSVDELGNKSVTAWLSSKDWVRLGWKRTCKRRKILFFQDLKIRLDKPTRLSSVEMDFKLNTSHH